MKRKSLTLLLSIAFIILVSSAAFAAGVEISNSYSNTEELMKKFSIANEVSVRSNIEKDIKNRLLNGFENWNRGYDAWISWGDILYTPESMYNIHGVRLTLEGYQEAMDATLSQDDILMGNFKNMIIVDDWCAIHYEASNVNRTTGERSDYTVMEFVNFKDYGDPLKVRVVEGWAGNKSETFSSMLYFANPDAREKQIEYYEELKSYEIPSSDNLEEKYPILRPVNTYDELDEKIKEIILEDFDAYNTSLDDYFAFLDSHTTEDFTFIHGDSTLSLEEYKESLRNSEEKETRLYFNNMIIRDGWAGIYYTIRIENADGAIETGSHMQFIHFEEVGGKVLMSGSWIS